MKMFLLKSCCRIVTFQQVFLNMFFSNFLFRCEIDWVKGQNVTVKTVKKKQKHKGRGTTRTITKTVQNDSFFNFFSPPQGNRFNHLSVYVLTDHSNT